MNEKKIIVIIGSNSIHTQKYINSISQYYSRIIFITNTMIPNIMLPPNIDTHFINFKLLNIYAKYKIANILSDISIKNPNSEIVVHIHQANSYAYHALRAVSYFKHNTKLCTNKCVVKTILSTWGSDILVIPHTNIIFKYMVQYNLKHADIIISNSFFISNQITKLMPHINELHTIYYGVYDFPDSLLNIKNKENIILSNRLHKPLYNIDKIIIEFAKLIKTQKYSDYELIITATGTETSNLINLTKKLNIATQVKFVGMLNYLELYEWYKRAKLFISIPDSDATAFSICEAMSFGCYPILSNLPASLELVLDDINGSICQNKDFLNLDIANALDKIEDIDAYQNIAKFNYDMIKQKAVYQNNIKKIITLY